MAKEQQAAPNAFAVANRQQENLGMENYKESAEQMLKDFSQVDVSMLQGLTQEYLQLKEDKTYNMVFKGMTKFKGQKGGEIPAVLLVGENMKEYINGNTVLVNSLSKVQQVPCLCRIITGKTVRSQNGTGSYLDMEILALPKVVNVEAD